MLTTYECWLWVYVRRCDMNGGATGRVCCASGLQLCKIALSRMRSSVSLDIYLGSKSIHV